MPGSEPTPRELRDLSGYDPQDFKQPDTTQLKQVEQRLRELENQYKTLVRQEYLDSLAFYNDLAGVFKGAGVKFDINGDLAEQLHTLAEKVKKTQNDLTATYYPRNGRC